MLIAFHPPPLPKTMSDPDFDRLPQESTAQFHRRHVLGALGLVGLGCVASAGVADAAPKVTVPTAASSGAGSRPAMRFSRTSSPLSEVSKDWAREHAQEANSYLRYLSGLKLRRVNPEQVLAAHAKQRGSVWNSLPPKQWWNRMGYVLKVVDRIALEMNLENLEVISAYRSPAYNALCGGRSHSWHQANVAADVKCSAGASKFTRTARMLRDEGLFRGGVGGYWGFTHVDARGQNVNW